MCKPVHGNKVWRTVSLFVSMWMVLTLAGLSPVLGAERISISYRDEPLTRVLERLSRESGFRIEVRGGENDPLLSGSVDALSLEGALWKIFKNHNHTIVWDLEGKTVTVFVYASSSPSAAGGAASARRASPPLPDAVPQRLRQLAPVNRAGAGRREDAGPVMVITGDNARFVESTRTMGR
jgi:hypothetical protein